MELCCLHVELELGGHVIMRWLPHRVTAILRFHCKNYISTFVSRERQEWCLHHGNGGGGVRNRRL